jgi:hypothetical protein
MFNTLNVLPPPTSSGIYPPMNMSHMHLFHHFSTFTSKSLVLGPQIWEEKVVPFAFQVTHASYVFSLSTAQYVYRGPNRSELIMLQHEYLMHAMLFMAASNLRHLQPQENCHRQQDLEHFSQVIPAFNAALSGKITDANSYALCSCSLVILQYSWACPELTGREANNAIEVGFGTLVELYSGMRRLALTLLTIHDPYLYSIMFYRPIETIKQYSEHTNIPSELEEFFTHCC